MKIDIRIIIGFLILISLVKVVRWFINCFTIYEKKIRRTPTKKEKEYIKIEIDILVYNIYMNSDIGKKQLYYQHYKYLNEYQEIGIPLFYSLHYLKENTPYEIYLQVMEKFHQEQKKPEQNEATICYDGKTEKVII